MQIASADVEFRHFHLFCGLGGGAKGFNRATSRVGNLRGRWRCTGGIDVDRAAIADFSRAAGVPGTVLDLFNEEQFREFHGKAPPSGWREATRLDIIRASNQERPNAVFLSAPCKGFSGLLPEKSSATAKYQALNGLTLRGVWLMLEAWKDDPPELIVFENVPRIMTRGRYLLDQIVALLRSYGYAVAETTHDCGEIGGLGQSRKRFLLVARHEEKVPPFLYEPERRRLRGVGEILERLPLPGDLRAGPMHRMPALQWKTWVRLAFVEAGSDWRSLNKLAVEDGNLRDFGILPDTNWQRGILGVRSWDQPSGVVTGRGSPTTGTFAVADPRFASGGNEYSQYGVRRWADPTGAVINVKAPGQGAYSVADPRVDGHPKSVQLGVRQWDQPAAVVKGDVSVGTGPYAVADPTIPGKPRFNNVFRIVPWRGSSPAVAGPGGPAGGLAVADPRATEGRHVNGKYRVTAFDEPASTVISASTTGNGAFVVADPRPPKPPEELHGKFHVTPFHEPARAVIGGRENGAYVVADPRPVEQLRSGAHGVRQWDETSGTVQGESLPSNGAFAVADPRAGKPTEALQGNWHITPFDKPAHAVVGNRKSGASAVADPRTGYPDGAHRNLLAVTEWNVQAKTITGADHVTGGALSVADPRPTHGPNAHQNKLAVTDWQDPAKTVTGSDRVGSGALSVADPRPLGLNKNRDNYMTGGHYGVLPWQATAGAVPAYAKYDRGRWAVADPRDQQDCAETQTDQNACLPAPTDRLVAVIRALDGTWHRPFTTLELAALQSLVDPDDVAEGFSLDGQSDSAWRERIGNAVPPDAAEAIAGVMGTTLLLAMTGETFMLSSQPIWVQPVAMALAVDQRGNIPWEATE